MDKTIGNIPAEGFWGSMKILAEGIDRLSVGLTVGLTVVIALQIVILAAVLLWRAK